MYTKFITIKILKRNKSNLIVRDTEPTSWSSGNTFAYDTEGIKLKSWASQIGQSVANDSPPLQHFFNGSCVAWSNVAKMGLANSLLASA